MSEALEAERERVDGVVDGEVGEGRGTESTISWAEVKADVRNGFRSSRLVESKSRGPRVLRASWRAAIVSVDC